jgi:hypothetical protein
VSALTRETGTDDGRPATVADFVADIPLEVAVRAHEGTSWSPEKRGEQVRADYATTLVTDFEALSGLVETDDARAALDAGFPLYREAYRVRTLAWLAARGRCLSTMIAGPSGFNSRRASKANDTADRRCQELIECRSRIIRSLRASLLSMRPVPAPSPVVAPPKAPAVPLLNYSGVVSYRNPFHGTPVTTTAVGVTRAQWAAIHADYKGTRVSACGSHRIRMAVLGSGLERGLTVVYLTDGKQHERPTP